MFSIIWTMWDIKSGIFSSTHSLLESIIWTMWDIKLGQAKPRELAYMYYLNHVGYKASLSGTGNMDIQSIIWTMWDIKHNTCELAFPFHRPGIIWTMWDIKEEISEEEAKKLLRIIWTMWDIKRKVLFKIFFTFIKKYYLNHVGYKVI